MKGYATLAVRETSSSYVVHEDIVLGETVCTVGNPKRTRDEDLRIAQLIAAALNDDTFISEADLAALEALAKRVQDRSEYGGGLILSLVNMYRNVKRQKPTE